MNCGPVCFFIFNLYELSDFKITAHFSPVSVWVGVRREFTAITSFKICLLPILLDANERNCKTTETEGETFYFLVFKEYKREVGRV